MAKKETKIIADIKKYYLLIKDKYDIKGVFLYGSYAKGNNNAQSDIDVGVVINGLEKMDQIKVLSGLYAETKKVNTLIEPICIAYSSYKKPLQASILAEIVKTSIRVI